MNEESFWALIESTTAARDDFEGKLAALRSALAGLSPEGIVAFEIAFREQTRRSYCWDLWGAATVIHGFMSDDAFEYFRFWLISKGRKYYELVLSDPDGLADHLESRADAEDMLALEVLEQVAVNVWEEKTGKSMDEFLDKIEFLRGQPSGTKFDQNPAFLARRYPKLWARFGLSPVGWYGDMVFEEIAEPKAKMSNCNHKLKRGNSMNHERFWALIEITTSFENDPRGQLIALHSVLADLSLQEVESFEAIFDNEMRRSYSWDLWGAAYVVHGGASDDGFEYFRCWLISKGREVFEKVLADPDSLADLLAREIGVHAHELEAPRCKLANLMIPERESVLEFELFAYVARTVWCEKTGEADHNNMPTAAPMIYPDLRPSGTEFENGAVYLAERYPKLWARFGANPLG